MDFNSAISSSEIALRQFANCQNRSVAVEVYLPNFTWSSHVNGENHYPAASLLKIPLAIAVELLINSGELNPAQRISLKNLRVNLQQNSVLQAFSYTDALALSEVLNFALISSDEPCTTYLRTLVPESLIHQVLRNAGCESTSIHATQSWLAIEGTTSALDSLRLIAFAMNKDTFPITKGALESSILNSRIPIGISSDTLRVAHKTGTLSGLAHDVAQIDSEAGIMRIAFMSAEQEDLIISGYEMGLCTNLIIRAWGFKTRSVLGFCR